MYMLLIFITHATTRGYHTSYTFKHQINKFSVYNIETPSYIKQTYFDHSKDWELKLKKVLRESVCSW